MGDICKFEIEIFLKGPAIRPSVISLLTLFKKTLGYCNVDFFVETTEILTFILKPKTVRKT